MRWLNVAAGFPASARDAPGVDVRVQRNVELFATAWVVLVLAADLAFRSVVLIGLLNVSTLLVSAVSSVRRTSLFAATAILLAAAAPLWDEGQTTANATIRVVNTSLLGGTAVGLAVLRIRRERQMMRIAAAAEAAQRAVLPTLPPRVGPVLVAARYHSAADEAMVGGDVFDMYYNDRGKVIALVGDVAGHGLGSVQEGARLIRAFRQYAPTSDSLEQLATLMDAYITPFLGPEVFVTAVLADVGSPHHLSVVSCGHPAPLLLTATGAVEVPVVFGPPLGLGASPESVDASVGAR